MYGVLTFPSILITTSGHSVRIRRAEWPFRLGMAPHDCQWHFYHLATLRMDHTHKKKRRGRGEVPAPSAVHGVPSVDIVMAKPV